MSHVVKLSLALFSFDPYSKWNKSAMHVKCDTKIERIYNYISFVKCFLSQQIQNMAWMRNFKVISDRYNRNNLNRHNNETEEY